MSPTDMRRLLLYERLIELLGDERAATLMEHLPPGGWDKVAATKDDVNTAVLLAERRLHSEITELRGEITELHGEIKHDLARQTRTMVFTMLGIAITIWLALLLPTVAG